MLVLYLFIAIIDCGISQNWEIDFLAILLTEETSMIR